MKVCLRCGKELSGNQQKWCRKACQQAQWDQDHHRYKNHSRLCLICHEPLAKRRTYWCEIHGAIRQGYRWRMPGSDMRLEELSDPHVTVQPTHSLHDLAKGSADFTRQTYL